MAAQVGFLRLLGLRFGDARRLAGERPSFAALKESARCPDSGAGPVIAVGSG